MSEAAIRTVGLTKVFGPTRAVDDLSLSVPEGSLFGLIGPNGAGKTTTFSLIAGFLAPTAGELWVRGRRLSPTNPRIGAIAALPQDAGLPPRTKTIDALTMLGHLGGLDRRTARRRGIDALERLDLGPEAHKPIGVLSHGQRRRVGIAQTLLGEGEVILLDEPTAGLDPRAQAELRLLIAELRRERTIVLSSHNLAEVESLCDAAAIIDHGKVVSAGPMSELRRASARITVRLLRPLEAVEGVVPALEAVEGVRSVRRADDRTIDIEIGDDGEAETATRMQALMKVLLDRQVAIEGMTRGQSLEQRFMEVTKSAT